MSFAALPRLQRAAEQALDFLLPPLCLSCDARVGENRTLCSSCWSQIHFIAPPLCTGCGAPFEAPVDEGQLCADCNIYPPSFAQARAAMLYDDASKRLIMSFKHGDRIHSTRALASWMRRAGGSFWATSDYLLPVPLHRWRLFKRRYNQAALLAQQLGIVGQKPVLVDALFRLRPTPIQGHMNRKERCENVRAAFALNPRSAGLIKDKTLILIDDVLTTGTRVNECSQLLLDSGAKAVNVLTLARVRGYS